MISLRGWLMQAGTRNRRLLEVARAVPTDSRRGYSDSRPSVGIIVIGNEILKGQVKDTNSFYACNLLYEQGVNVKKIAVVPDDIGDIATEMEEFSKTYTHVVTSGGIGPTHDDVTYEALAVAFDNTMHYHPTLVDIIRDRFGYKDFSSPGYKMAHVPKGAVLKFGVHESTGESITYPCIMLRNVYVFPGSPTYFRTAFKSLSKEMFGEHQSFSADEIYLNAREESFADALTAVVKEHPNVRFGSYPESSRYYKARVTIESDNENETRRAKERFCELVPQNVLVRYDREPQVDCLAKYERFLRGSQRRAIYESTFERLLELYRNPAVVSICLDGSVESVVLVHLARVVATKLRSGSNLRAIRFRSDEREHCENDELVRDIAKRYDLEVLTVHYQRTAYLSRAIDHLIGPSGQTHMLLLGDRHDSSRGRISSDSIFRNLVDTDSFRSERPLVGWTDEDLWTFVDYLSLPYRESERDS